MSPPPPPPLLQPLPAYDAFTLHPSRHCSGDGNDRDHRGRAMGNNSPYGGLFSESANPHNQHHSTPSPPSFYDPAKMGQHLMENQFIEGDKSKMVRRCLIAILVVSVVVFVLSSTAAAFLYRHQRREQEPAHGQHGPMHNNPHTHYYPPAGDFGKSAEDTFSADTINSSDRLFKESGGKRQGLAESGAGAKVDEGFVPGPNSISTNTTTQRPDYDELLSNELANPKKKYFAHWLPDDSLVVKDVAGNWIRADPIATLDSASDSSSIGSNHKRLFLASEEIEPYAIKKFSSDHRYVAVGTDVEYIYRHSKKALYKVGKFVAGGGQGANAAGRIENFTWVGLANNGEQHLQLVEWSPAYGVEDFAYVHENNIYYQPSPQHPELAFPLTSGGEKFRFYGVADWLYEEEILSDSKALWWSKSGNYLAYALFDDVNVTRLQLPKYYSHLSYPQYDEVAYPKVGLGVAQPSAFLWVWSKRHNSTQLILPPQELLPTEGGDSHGYYLFSVGWIQLSALTTRVADEEHDEDHLVVVWANRVQNYVLITVCQYRVPCYILHRLNFTQLNGMDLWAEPGDFSLDYQSPTGFFLILPHAHEDGNVYNWAAHLEVVGSPTRPRGLSGIHGDQWDFSQLSSYNRERDELFAYGRGDTIGSWNLYRIATASGSRVSVAPQCVSCVMKGCRTSRASFSPNGRRFVLACEEPYKQPKLYLKDVADIVQSTPLPYYPPGNHPVRALSPEPEIRLERIKTSLGHEAYVRIVYPPAFDSHQRYPVVLQLYAGPNSAEVTDGTPSHMITGWAQRGYVVVTIDGRGSNYRGWRLKSPIYRNLGGPEVDDQIDVLRLLLDKYPFMDKSRVASFGWSYGGFASLGIGLKDAGKTVHCVIAVAPVTDYHFYDSAYTERYMRLPEENPHGYAFTQLFGPERVGAIANVKLLLAHGEADDNVHYQNSALFARELQERSIHFTQLVYANEAHGIGGLYRHLYAEFDRFLDEECFNGPKVKSG